MKIILGTLITIGALAGAAQAKVFDEFNDPRLPLPRSDKFAGQDRFREALPRTGNDDFRQALPLSAPSLDDAIAKP